MGTNSTNPARDAGYVAPKSPPHKELLPSHRNEVFRAIEQAGFDPALFRWDERESEVGGSVLVPVLRYAQSQYYCAFDRSSPSQFTDDRDGPEPINLVECSPGHKDDADYLWSDNWNSQLRAVERWLTNLKREIETIDLWDTVAQERRLLEISSDEIDNTPFTPDEQRHIAEQLREIKAFLVEERQLSADHRRLVESRLAFLEDAARRQGRFDWRGNLLQILGNIFVALSLSQETGKELWRLAVQLFGSLFGSGPPTLPPGATT